MPTLNFGGLIKEDFDSGLEVVRIFRTAGRYVEGVWVPGAETRKSFRANVQPASDREIAFLTNGGERIVDARRLYINDDVGDVDLSGLFEFKGQRWKPVKIDNRPKRSYCKVIVARVDQ